MTYWTGVVSTAQYQVERLFQHPTVRVAPLPGAPLPVPPLPVPPLPVAPAAGDEVVLVAATDGPLVFGLGRVRDCTRPVLGAGVEVAYTHRIFDAPLPFDGALAPTATPGLHVLDEASYLAVASGIGPQSRVDADRHDWLVSLALPIEASTPAEAVRAFWTYVRQLGPAQLPAYVSPSGDELAMQAYLLGEPTNLDPEEDGG